MTNPTDHIIGSMSCGTDSSCLPYRAVAPLLSAHNRCTHLSPWVVPLRGTKQVTGPRSLCHDPVNTQEKRNSEMIDPGRFLMGKKGQFPWKELSMRFFVASETAWFLYGLREICVPVFSVTLQLRKQSLEEVSGLPTDCGQNTPKCCHTVGPCIRPHPQEAPAQSW